MLNVSRRAPQGVLTGSRERMARWSRPGPVDVLAAVLIAVGLYLTFSGGVPTRDPWHTLLWGSELASGGLPDYEAPFAPTPHPLLIVVAAVLSPLGAAAEPVLLAIAMVAVGAIAVGLFRLGERLYAWPIGLLAAAVVLTRTTVLYYGVRGGVDVMTLALIVWAAVLEARRPQRGAAVLGLLLLAGLLRPEAWLLAAAYWLWLVPDRSWRARAGLAALAAAAPLLWALSDLVVTGDPLWSLHGTQELAGELERPTGLSALPRSTFRAFRTMLTQPLLLPVAAAGLAAALAFFRRATLLPVAILVLNAIAFVALAIAGLPLNPRYLLPAGVVAVLFVAVAALGWSALPAGGRGRVRVAWAVGGVVALLVVAVSVPRQTEAIADLHAAIERREARGRDLRELLETARVQEALASCGPLVAPNVRLRPQFAYLTGREERSVAVARERSLPARGVFVRSAAKRSPAGPGAVGAAPPPGYRELERTRFWAAYARCSASAGPGGRAPEPGGGAGR